MGQNTQVSKETDLVYSRGSNQLILKSNKAIQMNMVSKRSSCSCMGALRMFTSSNAKEKKTKKYVPCTTLSRRKRSEKLKEACVSKGPEGKPTTLSGPKEETALKLF